MKKNKVLKIVLIVLGTLVALLAAAVLGVLLYLRSMAASLPETLPDAPADSTQFTLTDDDLDKLLSGEITLEELPEWQCCGAVYPQSNDEIATRLASVRALMAARDAGQPLVSLCSACHHVLKRVNGDMQHNDEIRAKVNNYLKPETPYAGETKVLHYLEVLRDEIGWDNVRKAVVKPLTGRKIGAYYGCMLLRPSREMQFDDPENPKMLEDFIRAIGAEPVVYAQRNECCGGYMAVENKAYAAKQAQKIMDNASAQGAELLITACPLCSYNLLHNTDGRLPVVYFTELLAEALGCGEEDA